jgi:toxin ParE1/3/4
VPKSFKVLISPQAANDIDEAFTWIAASDPAAAARWLSDLLEATDGLKLLPNRYPLAPESQLGLTDEEVRQFLHGSGLWKYRVLYSVKGSQVSVVHVRHGARLYIGQENPIEGDG